jgi:hypothetical protein
MQILTVITDPEEVKKNIATSGEGLENAQGPGAQS